MAEKLMAEKELRRALRCSCGLSLRGFEGVRAAARNPWQHTEVQGAGSRRGRAAESANSRVSGLAPLRGLASQRCRGRSEFAAKGFEDGVADHGGCERDEEVGGGEDVVEGEGKAFGGSGGSGELAHEEIGIEEKDDEGDFNDRAQKRGERAAFCRGGLHGVSRVNCANDVGFYFWGQLGMSFFKPSLWLFA
jgi:hypothetical protein